MTDLVLSGPALLPGPTPHIAGATVFVEQGLIRRIQPGRNPAADISVDEGCIAPGFIDLQINGALGADFTSDGHTVAKVSAWLPRTGVTAFVPTVITAPLEAYPKILREIREASRNATGAHPLGVHLEGPYLNPVKKGAHNPAFLRPVNVDEILRWADSPLVRIVTLAPELPGALDAVRALRRKGIVVSAGHSDATFAQAMAGFEAGITWGTHLYNTMSPLDHREPGLPGALLTSPVPYGLIVDGIHVHPAMVKLAFQAKGAGAAQAITLVTDAMEAMGRPPGRYKLGDRTVSVDETSARLADGTLAGSILRLDQAMRNMIAFTGCSLADALGMASTTPASVLGLERQGRLAPGCDADLVILDKALQVTHTIVSGQVVYAA